MKKGLVYLVALALITVSSLASADATNSFSGSVRVGVMFIDSANNLNPDASSKRLDSLSDSADSKASFLPVLLPEITWDVGEKEGMKLYLTTDPPIDEAGGFAANLGASYQFAEAGIIDVAAFFTPFEKAWKNPYLTGTDREETDTSKYGFRIGMNRIMGSGLRVQFVYLNDDVDNDVIGQLIPKLARDGSVYSLNMNYSYYISENLELRPRLSIRKGVYDGEANSFMKYKIDLETRYRTGSLTIIPRIHYSHSDYDETDPMFDKTRNMNSYGISLMTDYKAPFSWEDWSVSGLFSMSKGKSNIKFYDTRSLTFGGMLNYHF
ncbi:DUF2860 domain-containing protein [Marinifilum sp. JC120]|nr:DUF2860 domain-containing protein [Marinifilum sp. JC120]